MPERLVEIVRSIVRPILTISGMFFIFILILYGQSVPEWLYTQTSIMIAWWFADRTTSRNGNNNH